MFVANRHRDGTVEAELVFVDDNSQSLKLVRGR